jgi:hypothetical protein
MLELEVDQASLRDARSEIESEVGTVTVDADSGGFGGRGPAIGDGGPTALSETAGSQTLQSAQLEKLNDIHEELEKIGVSGGLGGGGGGGGGFGLPSIGAGAVLGKVFGKGTLLTGSMVLGALAIDEVGKQFADMTSDEWSNLIFGQAGGLVPSGFWSDQVGGEGLTIAEATIAVGNAALEGLGDILGDGRNSRADMLNISEDRLMSERLVEQKQEQLLNTPQSDLGTGRTISERIKANPGSVKLVGMNWQTMMATVSVRGSTMQIPYETLPGNLKNKAIQGNFAGGGGGGGGSGGSTGGGTTPAGAPSPARQDQEVRQALVGAVKETLGDQTMNIDIYNEYTIDPSGTRLIEEEFEKKANEAKKEAVNEIKEIMGADTTGSPQRYGPG